MATKAVQKTTINEKIIIGISNEKHVFFISRIYQRELSSIGEVISKLMYLCLFRLRVSKILMKDCAMHWNI